VAIHCDPASEETSRTGCARHDGLPRRPLPLSPRNDKLCVVIVRAESPWRSTGSQ